MTSPVFVGVIDEPVAVLAAAQVAAHARAAGERRRRRRPVVGLDLPVGLGRSPARRQRVGIERVRRRLRPVDPDLAHGDVRLRRSDRRRLQPFAEAPPARVALGEPPPLRVEQLEHQIDARDPLQPRVHRARALACRHAVVVDVALAIVQRRADRPAHRPLRQQRRVPGRVVRLVLQPVGASRSQGRRTKTTAAAAATSSPISGNTSRRTSRCRRSVHS